MRGLGVFVAKPERTPLAYSSEDVSGLGLAGLSLAFRVVVRHVGPGACLVELEQGDCMEKAPCWLPGRIPSYFLAQGIVWRPWSEAQNGEGGIGSVEGLCGGCLPCTSHRRPDGTGRRAVVHYVGDRLFPSFSRGL